MSVQGGPYITNNGLVLAVDFANAKSYVSGSSTVYNLDPIVSSSTGSLFNGPVFVNENFGALSFDGTNDYVRINNFPGLPTGSSPRTVSIWFNTTSASWVGNTNNLFFYGTPNVNGQTFGIDFDVYPVMELFTWGSNNYDFIWSSSFLQRGWKNLTITYNGSNTLSIYENGSLRTSKTNLVTTNTANTDIWLGSINPSFQSWYFDGKISSLKIYNRALSSSEVLQAYNSEFGRYKRTTPINEGLYLITGSTNLLNTFTQSSFLVNSAYTGSHLLLMGGTSYRTTTISNVSDSKGNKWNPVHSLTLNAVPGTAYMAVGEINTPLSASDTITIVFATTASNSNLTADSVYLYKIQASQWVVGQNISTYSGGDIVVTSSMVYNYPSYHAALGSLGQNGFINGRLTKTIECETLLDTGGVFNGGMRFFERSYPISGSVRMGMTLSGGPYNVAMAMVSFL